MKTKFFVSGFYKTLVVVFFIIVLTVVSGVLFSLSILKDEAIKTHQKVVTLYSSTFTEQITQTFNYINLSVNNIESILSINNDTKILEQELNTILTNNSYIRSINILNKEQKIIYSSNKQNIGIKIEVDTFYPKPLFHQNILRFGKPYLGRDFDDNIKSNKSSFIPLSKSIKINDDLYHVVFSINSDNFVNKYVDLLKYNLASLDILRVDGVLLFSSDPTSKLGSNIPSSNMIEKTLQNNNVSSIELYNNKQYMSAYRLTDMYPLNIVVRLDYDQTMIDWEDKKIKVVVLLSILVILSVLLVFILILKYDKELKNINKELSNKVKKRTRELEAEKNKAEDNTKIKSEFLANMSHELRTPMSGILGLVHLVLQTDLSPKQKNYLKKVDSSAKSLLNILNDVLDFSKIEAGKLIIEKIDFNLEDIVGNLKNILELKALEKGLEFNIEYDKNNTIYYGDSFRINQILLNITNNAIKFTHKGKIDVIINSINNEKVRFEIRDTGIGLGDNQQIKLFKSFSQADGSTTRKYGGTGLGLSISKQLVELLNGKIWIESEADIGSSFIFEIELARGDINNIESSNDLEVKNEVSLSSTNILLTEDNLINQEIVLDLLEDSGVSIDIASNGEESVSMFTSNPNKYDLILMDIQMPIMDGYEATKLIRKNDKDIPIIALTANVMQSDIQKTKEAGMNEHLHKPIDVSTLFKVLSKYINKEDNFSKDNKDTTMKIPNFKNIDKSIGLNYLSNNEELYLKILKSFYNDYKDFKIEKKDEDSLIKIHTLKGLSATIGAVELNHVVIQLHDTHDITLISEVESKLKIVIDELEVIL